MKKLVLIPLIALCGCNVQKRQIEKQHYLNFKRPEILAEDFNRLFPSKPDSVGRIVYADNTADKKRIDSLTAALNNAKPTYIIDSTFCDTAALYRHYLDMVKDNKKLRLTIADIKQAYDNKKPDILPTYQKSCPEIPMLKTQLRTAEDNLLKEKSELEQVKKTKNILMWTLIGIAVVAVAYGAIKAYKFFTTGGLSSLKSIIK